MVDVPGKHFPQLTGAEQNASYTGTAVEFTERHTFVRHGKAWGAAHTGPGIRFICDSDAIAPMLPLRLRHPRARPARQPPATPPTHPPPTRSRWRRHVVAPARRCSPEHAIRCMSSVSGGAVGRGRACVRRGAHTSPVPLPR